MSKRIRRISIFGAPGAGKTVLAHELFAHYKKAGRICEVVNELAREWAYVDRPVQSMDQLYLFSTQLHREDTLLTRNKGEFIITDSPIMLNAFYGVLADPSLIRAYDEFGRRFEEKFPTLNIFCPLDKSFAFHTEGRFHNQEQSQLLNDQLLHFMSEIFGKDNFVALKSRNRLKEALKILKAAGI